ncbi:YrhB domain-containing protein [Streptomyces sp. NPDC059985]|uniref:YrhB domain-containing protein n=1 Tax=Streptomyces sp. NPDC059985 TaxID=3347025 RepID=UPI0036BE4A8D
MNQDEARQLAVALLARSRREHEPPLAIDTERVRESNGLLIVPYNSVQYLASRDRRQQLLDCWPILVDLASGDVRFGTLDERHLWRNPSSRRALTVRDHTYGTAFSPASVEPTAQASMPRRREL